MKALIPLLFLLSACAGYRFTSSKNPFERYGIKSVAIPTFVNHSSLGNISDPFTREMTLMLSDFPGLKIRAGEARADAILIGVISSEDKLREVSRPGSRKYTTDGGLSSAIGERGKFYIPNSTNLELTLHIVLIKDPTNNERKLLQGRLGPAVRSPRVLINEKIMIRKSFDRMVKGGTSYDSGKVVNFTMNRGIMRKKISEMAFQASETFRETVVNAF